MIDYTKEDFDRYFDYLEAITVDPFATTIKAKGKASKEVKFINAARAEGLNDIAVAVGLLIITKHDVKKKWTVDEVVSQIKQGIFIDDADFDKYILDSTKRSKPQIDEIAAGVYDRAMKRLKSIDVVATGLATSKRSTKPRTYGHEYNKGELAKIKTRLQTAWGNLKANTGKDLKIDTETIEKLVLTLAREQARAMANGMMPDSETNQNILSGLKKLIENNILWEYPDVEIKESKDLDAYFVQLEKSRPEQEKRIGMYAKKSPERRAAKSLKSEGKELAEIISNKAEEIKPKVIDRGDDATIKLLNAAAEKIVDSELQSTGRKVSEYLKKERDSDDPVSWVVGELNKEI